jgi:hypothetical protein
MGIRCLGAYQNLIQKQEISFEM